MTAVQAPIGFIGIGLMGEPMALNLLKAHGHVVVWNRTQGKCAALEAMGAVVAPQVADVFATCRTVITMLVDGTALDSVLKRGSSEFASLVQGCTIVNMATTAPEYSMGLAMSVRDAGGSYVEAPVSGSRAPAQSGRLIAMLAGDPDDIAAVNPLLFAMCRDTVPCGPIPSALYMKLTVNLYMINMITGLAEAVHLAEKLGLDIAALSTVLELGPMSSELARLKLKKLIGSDFAPQAAISDVLENARLIVHSARRAGVVSPLIEVCHALYAETSALGLRNADMVAVIRAIECRTQTI